MMNTVLYSIVHNARVDIFSYLSLPIEIHVTKLAFFLAIFLVEQLKMYHHSMTMKEEEKIDKNNKSEMYTKLVYVYYKTVAMEIRANCFRFSYLKDVGTIVSLFVFRKRRCCH